MSGALVLSLRLGIAILLYGFLGWGLFILWRDLKEKGIGLAGRTVPALNLIVQRGQQKTERRVFMQAEILLGRDPACDLSLNDDAVSARHARLSHHHGQWWAEDLNSTNGTRLNQAPLITPTVLTTGDQVECGNTALIVSIGGISETSPTIRST
jgi:pSer/pThr/pTyr-binding forkhead associated (FHA) protein